MATVFDYSRALAKALRESSEARRMRGLGAKVKQEPRLEKLLRDFRQAQYEMQALHLQGKEPGKNLVDRFTRLAKLAEGQQLLADYLAAENAYGEMLVEVQQILAEVFNPDVPGSAES